MKTLAIFGFALACALSAFAAGLPVLRQTAPSQMMVMWDNPANRTDGTAITAGATNGSTTVGFSIDRGTNWVWSTPVLWPATSRTVAMSTGVVWFICYATEVRGGVTNDSDFSETFAFTNVAVRPLAPVLK